MLKGHLVLSLAAVGAISFAAYRIVETKREAVHPGPNLLFNGRGMSPVGDQVQIGDMPVKIVFSPDKRQLVTSTIGFGGVHLTTLDAATHKVIQTLDLDRVWNGLAFSPDGK